MRFLCSKKRDDMITNYKNQERGKELKVDTNSIILILKDINAHIQTAALTLELSDMDDVTDSIELAQELSLQFEYTLQRKIKFCGVIIWSDSFNSERRIESDGTTVVSLETFLLNEIHRIIQLINKIVI